MRIDEVFNKIGDKRKAGKLTIELVSKTEVVVIRDNGKNKLIDMKISLINMPLEVYDRNDEIELICKL